LISNQKGNKKKRHLGFIAFLKGAFPGSPLVVVGIAFFWLVVYMRTYKPRALGFMFPVSFLFPPQTARRVGTRVPGGFLASAGGRGF
jgi:hypothetical protein